MKEDVFIENGGVEIIVRNFIIFIMGFCLSFILSPNLFDENSGIINTLYRVCFGLFFLFIIWIVQPKRNNGEDKKKMINEVQFYSTNGAVKYHDKRTRL